MIPNTEVTYTDHQNRECWGTVLESHKMTGELLVRSPMGYETWVKPGNVRIRKTN